MKNRIIYALITLALVFVSALSEAKAQTQNTVLPTLRGEDAVKQLKQNGQYDSLMEAVKAARKENGQTDEDNLQDAVGQLVKLTASDGATSDRFGWSVAVSGDTAIVGAYLDDVGANADQGSAYVFEREGTTWTQKAKLVDNSGAANDHFGFGVSISGDKIVVGAPLSDAFVSTPLAGDFVPAATEQGAALLFVNTPLAPTAAMVSIGGRVFAGEGCGLANAIVYLTDSEGNTQAVRTNSFGYYRFDEIEAGQTVIVFVSSKRFSFAPQIVNVTEKLDELNFLPEF